MVNISVDFFMAIICYFMANDGYESKCKTDLSRFLVFTIQ